MATTTNYGWTLPTVNGDGGTWGAKLNTIINAIDALVKTVSDAVTSAASTASYAASAAAAAATTAGAALVKSNNLSDLTDASAARTHLGLGSIATHKVTISSSGPSGTPADGDIWIQYTP